MATWSTDADRVCTSPDFANFSRALVGHLTHTGFYKHYRFMVSVMFLAYEYRLLLSYNTWT